MSEPERGAAQPGADISLVMRRTIRAPVERVFAAWTEPARLRTWWGPQQVSCAAAEVDLRVGGSYRLANRFGDGRVIWISGEFLEVEPPHRLVYTWSVDDPQAAAQDTRVTVRFEPHALGTDVIVLHEQFASRAAGDHHALGWHDCLLGLAAHCADAAAWGTPAGA